MSNDELGELVGSILEPHIQVDQLITQGKIKEAMKVIDGRKKEEGLEDLRWRIVECRCRNVMGEHELVIKLVEEIKKEIEESAKQKGERAKRMLIDTLKEQAWALQRLGRLKTGLEKVEEGIRLIDELEESDEKDEENKDSERRACLLDSKGGLYNWKGELDKALVYFKKSLTIREEIGNKQPIARSLNNIGVIYHQKGELGQALDYYEKSLVIKEELGNKPEIAKSLNNIGVIYRMKGELDQALDYYEKSLIIKVILGNKQEIANSLNNIGVIYRMKGELDQALDYYEKSLVMRENLGNKKDIANSLNYIGELNYELGALNLALDFFKQSLIIYEEIGNKLDVTYSLFGLIRVAIDLEEIKQANDYLSDLQLINDQLVNKLVDLRSRLAEALILKKSKRRKNLAKAEEILIGIVEEEVSFHDLTVQALVNLSELLLDELNSTSEEEILEELEEKVEKLVEKAKEQQSYSLLTESYWLKAQLALVRLDLTEARSLLSQAQMIAEEKGLERLARKISSEHDHLLEQMDQWDELIAKDASIAERVKIANLEELVGWMARKREIKIEEKEDEPVMILLVSDSGLPIYSKHFGQERELQDILISGFLSSI
ncbi:MAG: tetratricopeptide repeat protein, partial [Candidatus Kariarchaeaceae archaeon]